jgi:hypothetical protein
MIKIQNETTASDTAHNMTPLQALMTLAGVAVFLGLFLTICHFLGVEQFWPAFIFLLYWGMIEKVDVGKIRSLVIGGVLGLLIGYSSSLLAPMLGEQSGLVFLGLVVVLVFFQLMGKFVIAINPLTMIYLTICTIPAVSEGTHFGDSIVGFALGVVYFGGLLGGGQLLKNRSSSSD